LNFPPFVVEFNRTRGHAERLTRGKLCAGLPLVSQLVIDGRSRSFRLRRLAILAGLERRQANGKGRGFGDGSARAREIRGLQIPQEIRRALESLGVSDEREPALLAV